MKFSKNPISGLGIDVVLKKLFTDGRREIIRLACPYRAQKECNFPGWHISFCLNDVTSETIIYRLKCQLT